MTVRDEIAHLPLKQIEFHVLLVLADGALHGYGIVKEIEARTEGRVSLEPGNLYRHIRALEEKGLVTPEERRSTGDSSRERRRYYAITPLGSRVLAADAARMRALVAAAEARVEVPPA